MTPVLAAEYLALTLPGTPESVADLVGLPAERVACLRAGMTPGAVTRRRRALDAYTLRRPRDLSDEERDLIVEWTRAGLTAPQIADRLGISDRTVVRVRRARGISQRTARYTDAEVAQIVALLERGASYREVARTTGHAPDHIARRWPGYGWRPDDCGRIAGLWRRYPALLAELGGAA